MPSKTWYLEEINVGGTNPNRLWWDEDSSAVPAQTTSVTGWTVAKTAANNNRLLSQGAEVAGFASTVDLTTLPVIDSSYTSTAIYTPPTLLSDVESISTLYEYNGVFPAGSWTFSFPVIAVSSGGDQDGRIIMRVFKARRDEAGTGWTGTIQLTSNFLTGTTVSNLTTTTSQTSVVTWSAPAFQLNKEFLICKIAWQIVGAGGANSRDVLLRYGTGATMISPNFRKRSYNIS
jgi:hypothetical protein